MFFKLIYPSPEVQKARTRDSTIYLYRAFRVAGLIMPKSHRALYRLWICAIFTLTMLYLPLNFVINYFYFETECTPMEFITSLQVALNAVGLAIKLNILRGKVVYLDKANSLMDLLDVRCNTERELVNIRDFVAFGNKLHLIYSFIYIGYPTIGLVTAFINGRPAYNIYFPFLNWHSSWKLLSLQAFAEYLMVGFASFQATIVDSYPIIFVESLRRHINMLSERINNLKSLNKKYSDENIFKKDLISCIKDHKILLTFFRTIETVLSGTIFTQFIICGSVIGIAIIMLSLFDEFSTRFNTMVYLVAVLLQTFPLCYCCNCLIDDSQGLSVALFHSGWHNRDHSYKKITLQFMRKLQKPMIFYALNIFSITLDTNIKVAKVAFTVYTLAQQMNLADRLTK